MNRIEKVKSKLKEAQLDALFIKGGANIRYLTGYTGGDAFLLVSVQGKSVFITDFRYIEQAEKECAHCRDLEITRCGGEGKTPLDVLEVVSISQNLKVMGFEEEGLSFGFYQKLKNSISNLELIPTSGVVEELRSFKDITEQSCLKKAAEIADKALTAILPKIEPGITEIHLEALLNYELSCHGSQGQAFPPIVASGLNGSLCHAIPSHKKLAKGEFITLDFGAVFNGYRSDMTRTFVLGAPNRQQKQVYKIVLEAQQAAVAKLKAGIICSSLDKTARDIITKKGFGEYFGHSLGHGIGLDIHEKPTLNALNMEPLGVGQVVTVEPGIYIPNWGGVRIEDSIIVMEDKGEVITHFPKELMVL